jgi:hypothetical protein
MRLRSRLIKQKIGISVNNFAKKMV